MFFKRSLFKGADGFSLAELTVVLLGAMILLALSVPVVDRVLDQYRLVMAAQTITTQSQFARMKAVASNEVIRVNFPTGENFFRIEDSSGSLMSGPFYLPRGVTWDSVTFPGRFVLFSPTGNLPSSGNGSAGQATIVNPRGLKIDITVNAGGMVRQTAAYR